MQSSVATFFVLAAVAQHYIPSFLHSPAGWHIECSTMIREVMGEQIDIHGGGRWAAALLHCCEGQGGAVEPWTGTYRNKCHGGGRCAVVLMSMARFRQQ